LPSTNGRHHPPFVENSTSFNLDALLGTGATCYWDSPDVLVVDMSWDANFMPFIGDDSSSVSGADMSQGVIVIRSFTTQAAGVTGYNKLLFTDGSVRVLAFNGELQVRLHFGDAFTFRYFFLSLPFCFLSFFLSLSLSLFRLCSR
jgi:hypothetical protein